jgi:hypothetical protein
MNAISSRNRQLQYDIAVKRSKLAWLRPAQLLLEIGLKMKPLIDF